MGGIRRNKGEEAGGRDRTRARRQSVPAAPDIRHAAARALVVSGTDATAMLVGPVLGELEVPMECQYTVDDARLRLSQTERPRVDVLVLHQDTPGAQEFIRQLSISSPAISCVIVSQKATLDDAITAMRCGAVDIISAEQGTDLAGAALRSALDRSRVARQREERAIRLRSVCKKLNSARHEVTNQVSDMCNDLVDAYRELSGEIDKLSVCGEFNGVIRQELEIESLLRVVLEFILAKTGPTNAAIYLPSSGSEFSLGAYVNADIPKASVDALLDHLADVLAPRFEQRPGVHQYDTRRDVARLMGPDAHWLPEQTLLAFPCLHNDECLAVVTLFRDDHEHFSGETVKLLDTISALFSRQLARIIHVHHRHLPKHKWGAIGDAPESYDYDEYEGPDDIDLAA